MYAGMPTDAAISPAEAAAPAQRPEPRAQFGAYRVLRPLGRVVAMTDPTAAAALNGALGSALGSDKPTQTI